MESCSIEILDASLIDIGIDTSLPRTSMTMKIENDIEEDTGNAKTGLQISARSTSRKST